MSYTSVLLDLVPTLTPLRDFWTKAVITFHIAFYLVMNASVLIRKRQTSSLFVTIHYGFRN